MKSICVYLGSMRDLHEDYIAAARELGRVFAERKIRLIYGGGNVGLMGELANSVLENGGEVTGVIPRPMVEREWAHMNLTAMHVVETMHERKAMMAELADAFIAMPGGLGTLEEIAECLTWIQLGFLHKPAAFWNVRGYYDLFAGFITQMEHEGFIRKNDRDFIFMHHDIQTVLEYLAANCAQNKSQNDLSDS